MSRRARIVILAVAVIAVSTVFMFPPRDVSVGGEGPHDLVCFGALADSESHRWCALCSPPVAWHGFNSWDISWSMAWDRICAEAASICIAALALVVIVTEPRWWARVVGVVLLLGVALVVLLDNVHMRWLPGALAGKLADCDPLFRAIRETKKALD